MIALLALAFALPASALSLSEASQRARYAPDCVRRIPLEHAPSFPLPVKTKSGLAYRQMFYAVTPAGVYAPGAVAQFDAAGKTSCAVDVDLPRGDWKPLGAQLSAKAAAMSGAQYEAESAKLLAALERAGKPFMAGTPDPKAAAEISALFAALSEPALGPSYRALSPEFWAWLEKK